MALDVYDEGRGEPTAQEAAELVEALMGMGTVSRLDTVHAALLTIYRRGRSDVRDEAQELCRRAAQQFADAAQKLAWDSANRFVESVTERAAADHEVEALPWPERLRVV